MKRKLFAVFGSAMILGSGMLAGGCGDSGTTVVHKDAAADKAGDAKGGAGEAGGTGGAIAVDANAGGASGAGGGTPLDGSTDTSADVNNVGGAGGIDGGTTPRGGSGGTSNGGAGGSTTGPGGIDGGRDVGSGGDAPAADRPDADRPADVGGIDGGIDGSGIDTAPCTPNSHQCSGNAVQTCSAAGQWGAAVACAFPTPACTAGACTNATLTVTKAGTGTGTVTSPAPNGINCGNTCSRTFATTPVVLTATAAAGSTFTGWSGGGCTGTTPCSVSLTAGNVAVTATFTAVQNTLTVSKAGSGTGTVTSAPTGISCGATCSAPFSSGASVVLTAAAATGSVFAGWSGGGCSGVSTCTVTMSAATTVTATFSLPANTLTIVRAGTGTGTVTSTSTPAAATNINCGATCAASFAPTASVVLTATPATGSAFTGWSGGGCTGVDTCTLSVTVDTIVTANFAPVVGCKTVATAGTCGGTAVGGTLSATSATACHDQCQAAMAAAGTASGCWMLSGATCSCRSGNLGATGTDSGGTCARGDYALNVTKAGNGTGEVTSGTDIACGTTGTTCSALFAANDSVTLTAAAGTGSTFTGWSGGVCTGANTTCTVSMTAATNVTATFTLSTFALTVTTAGAGSGIVTSPAPGINCGTGTGCSHSYNYGTSVTLTAAAASGSVFAGWSGACSGTSTTCTVSITAATAVTATFVPPLGCTTVQDALAANCSTDTTTPVERDLGTSLTAQGCHDGCETAMAAAGMNGGCWVLSGNQHCYCRNGTLTPGGGSSPGGSCAAGQHALTVSLAGDGSGTVTSNSGNISCGAVCSDLFAPGSNNVTLTATPTPASGSTFAGWSGGGCTGTNTTCIVSMTADINVTATFVVPLACDADPGNATGCGGTAVATPTAATATACQNQCGTPLAASGAASGCWLFQGGTCSCRNGALATGTGTAITAGSCN